MRHKDIKYRVYKYTTRIEEGQLIRRGLGFLHEDNSVGMKNTSKVYTYAELEDMFGKDGLQKVINFENEEYEINYQCDVLDELFEKIKSITKDAFVSKQTIKLGWNNDWVFTLNYDYTQSPLTKENYKEKRFIITWEKENISANCGSDIPYSALYEFVEKLRRFYEYDDPYKHKVDNKSLIDAIYQELTQKKEENE